MVLCSTCNRRPVVEGDTLCGFCRLAKDKPKKGEDKLFINKPIEDKIREALKEVNKKDSTSYRNKIIVMPKKTLSSELVLKEMGGMKIRVRKQNLLSKLFFIGCIIFAVWGFFGGGQQWIETNILPPQVMQHANLQTLAAISPSTINIIQIIPMLLAAIIIMNLVVSTLGHRGDYL